MKTNLIQILACACALLAVRAANAQEHEQPVHVDNLFLNLSIESDGRVTDDFTLGVTEQDPSPRGEHFRIEKSSDSYPTTSIAFNGMIKKIDSTSYLLTYQFDRTVPIEFETSEGKKSIQYKSDKTQSSLKVTLGKETTILKGLDGSISVLLNKEED